MGIVDGTQKRNAAGVNQDLWDQGNNEALTALYLCMGDDEVATVSGCITAHDVWSKLNAIYQMTSGESKQALWQQYYSVHTTPDKSPVQTMVEIQNYASQLRSMGAVIDQEMEVARIISSLMDDKYRQFREAWRSVDVEKQTTALLLSRLKTWELEEEASNNMSSTNLEESYKAFTARFTKDELAVMKKNTTCHVCNKLGHWKNECPERTYSGAYMAKEVRKV